MLECAQAHSNIFTHSLERTHFVIRSIHISRLLPSSSGGVNESAMKKEQEKKRRTQKEKNKSFRCELKLVMNGTHSSTASYGNSTHM